MLDNPSRPASKQTLFWQMHDKHFDDAKTEITKVAPRVIVDYVKSMLPVYEIIMRDSPDAVFVPDRGAAPLRWALEAINEVRGGKPINFISLPIGSKVDIVENSQSGYKYLAKHRIIEQEIKRQRNLGNLPDKIKHIVLLDEAQSGSTSATATQILKNLFENDNPKITYIPCKDEGRRISVRKSDDTYKQMATGEWANVEGFSISVPMFFIDKPAFLDDLVSPSKDSNGLPENPELMIMKMHNLPAKLTFRAIVLLVLLPDVAKALVVPGVDESNLSEDLIPYYFEMRDWGRSILAMYPDVSDNDQLSLKNKERRGKILDWFRSINNIVNAQASV